MDDEERREAKLYHAITGAAVARYVFAFFMVALFSFQMIPRPHTVGVDRNSPFFQALDGHLQNDRPGVTNNDPNKKPGDTEQDEDDGSLVSGRKDDYYTFLLIGRDTAGGGNTDTLILVSYDVPNGQVNMMSIPRDTAVNVSWTNKKINSVYNAKESNGGGMEGLKQQVAYLTGVMPDRYVIIEWKAVGELVDAVDGQLQDLFRHSFQKVPLGVHAANVVVANDGAVRPLIVLSVAEQLHDKRTVQSL